LGNVFAESDIGMMFALRRRLQGCGYDVM
jgi:hypothetical protein